MRNLLFAIGLCLVLHVAGIAQPNANVFPFKDLPNDRGTELLQAIYSIRSLVIGAQQDSVWDEMFTYDLPLTDRQEAIKNYLLAIRMADNQLYDRASQLYHESLRQAVDHQWKDLQYHNLTSLASLEYYLDRRDSAYAQWNSVVDSIPEHCWFMLAVTHSNIAAVGYELWALKKVVGPDRPKLEEKIKYHYDKAITILRDHGEERSLCRIYGLYAMFFLDLNDPTTARKMLEDAMVIGLKDNNIYQYHFNLINWGKFYLKQGDYQPAIDSLQKAIAYFDQQEIIVQQHHAVATLSNVYGASGRYKEQSELLRIFIRLKTSLSLDKMARQAHLFRTEFEVYDKDRQIEQQKIEKALVQTNRNRWIIGLSSLSVTLLLGIILVIQFLRQRARNEKNALLIREREHAFSAVVNAQESERKRIARELHDGLGQQLSGIKMTLQHLVGSVEKQESSIREQMDGLINVVSQSSKEVRTLAHQMMPQMLEARGLGPALEDLVGQNHSSTGIAFSFENALPTERRFRPEIELNLYRGLQELINNTMKHAAADRVDIQIYELKAQLIAVYSDNGKGFQVDQPRKGLGLASIRSRIEHLQGTLIIESQPGAGFNATFRIPISS